MIMTSFNRLLLFIALTCSSFAATLGQIDSITVDTNGWNTLIQIYTGGANGTNGTFSNGLGTNNLITGNQKLTITMNSPGYDDTGATQVVAQTLYGTWPVRFPYPNAAYPDTTNISNDIQIREALSQYVTTKDVSLTASIVTNLYAKASAATNQTASGISVVNNSLLSYQKVLANWTWPGWNLISATPYKVRLMAAHSSGQKGRPVRVVRVICTDQHSHTSTNYVTQLAIDSTLAETIPTAEYLHSCDLSSMTALDLIRFDFAAFPWIGDSGAVCDTTDGAYTRPTICYAPQTNRYDPSNGYGYCHALVDVTNGVDATGVAANLVYWATNTTPAAFKTINGALVACKGTNGAAYAPTKHTDPSYSILLLTNGTYAWTGGSGAYGTNGMGWVTITTNSAGGATTAGVIIGSQSGNKGWSGGLTHLQGITITAGSGSGVFSGENEIWFDGCVINNSTSPMVYQDKAWYLTGCTVTKWKDGIVGFSTENAAPALIRNCTITNINAPSISAVVIGNIWYPGTVSSGGVLYDKVAGGNAPYPQPVIIYNNKILYRTNVSQIGLDNGVTMSNTFGAAIIQNVLEGTTAADASPIVGISSDGVTTPHANMLLWCNTVAGNKFNYMYQDTGSTLVWKQQSPLRWELHDQYFIKTDTFTGSGGGNGARWGNWGQVWGVGYEKNVFSNITNMAGVGNFQPEFYGLNNFPYVVTSGSQQPPLCAQQTNSDFVRYVANGAYNGVTAGSGNGNYRLKSDSPAVFMGEADYPLAFDISGQPRGRHDPPGAYCYGTLGKCAGFFAP